ncbi:MAG: hypothetical protein HDR80_02950 [Bacteroides sp.]|nr:hypothetical protein [Bacteroides sp.]
MRKYRYIWLPVILLVYGLAIAAIFGPEFVRAGKTLTLVLSVAADVIVCILLFIFLRKKSRLPR